MVNGWETLYCFSMVYIAEKSLFFANVIHTIYNRNGCSMAFRFIISIVTLFSPTVCARLSSSCIYFSETLHYLPPIIIYCIMSINHVNDYCLCIFVICFHVFVLYLLLCYVCFRI